MSRWYIRGYDLEDAEERKRKEDIRAGRERRDAAYRALLASRLGVNDISRGYQGQRISVAFSLHISSE